MSIPGIPGLGMLTSIVTPSTAAPQLPTEPKQDTEQIKQETEQTIESEPTEAVFTTDQVNTDLVTEKPSQQDATDVVDHLNTLPAQDETAIHATSGPIDSTFPSDATMDHETTTNTDNDPASVLLDLLRKADNPIDPSSSSSSATNKDKQPVDPEFLEAAKAQHDNQEAEWQYDTSDAESSSDDSSDDSSSDEESDDDYEMLDPATAAKMLMDDAGEDDDGAEKATKSHQLRTKNEKPEQIVPKPDVTVTPEMQITQLGLVENVVDNMILVKANTSGEYQVLESGSVLCLENRDVIGAVAETIGRVQEPLYIVAFTSAADIASMGITQGSNIFYVNSHSTFVFTEPLRAFKGTDASNLHDEELPEEEMEFSDDEAEAAYKRAKKEAKKSRNADRHGHQQPIPVTTAQPYTGGAINYDDESEDVYTPLPRPDNLQQMLANGAPGEERARQSFPPRGRGDRGRGGRGRGGDRGRGADRGRGGRGGRGNADAGGRGGHKGVAKSFPDNHNQQVSAPYQQQPLPQKPAAPQSWSPSQGQQQFGAPQQPAFPHFTPQPQQQFPPSQSPHGQAPHQPPLPVNQPMAWPQMTNPQQFQQFQQFVNTYATQSGQQGFQYPPMPPPTPGGSIPAGAFVNPNFFPGGHQQQHQQPQYPQPGGAQTQGSAQGPSADAIQGAQELLRRLGADGQ